MIRLKNIKKTDSHIKCDIIPEDSKAVGYLDIDLKSEDPYKTANYSLPAGYEWCKNHVSHAIAELIKMGKGKEIPKEKSIMWH